MKKGILLIVGAVLSFTCFGQSRSAREAIQAGNDLYKAGNYDSAKARYLKSVALAPKSFKGYFNLGDALFQKESYDEARNAFQSSIQATDDPKLQAMAYHNIGNTFLKQKKWQNAVNAFKNALKRNGRDPNTKYNLAYAQKMLQKSQQKSPHHKNNQKQQDQKQQDQKQQDQKKQKQRQDKEKKPNPSENKDDKSERPKEGSEDARHPKPMPSKLTRQEAENLLNALNQEEKQLHKKKKKETGTPVELEKDW